MRRGPWKTLVLVGLIAGGVFAYAGWPRINDVETGKTPEYPDLQTRKYLSGETAVAKAARSAILRLPRWTLVGEGSGPGGTAIQAEARSRFLRLTQEVTIRIKRQGGQTRVDVRSRSRFGKWDFGQNARNIRAFLHELDRSMVGY